jgi:integrase
MKNIFLFKRNRSDSYFIQFMDEDGSRKQLSTRCTSKADALRFLAELKIERKKPTLKAKSLSEFTKDFLLYASTQFRSETVKIHKFALALLLESVGNAPMNSITPRHVDRWKSELLIKPSRRGGQLSAVYLNIHFRSLKASFNTALRWGLIRSNPFVMCKPLPLPSNEPVSLSIEEFRARLPKIKDEYIREITVFAINTGARLGEILSLRWDAVDLDKRQIIIRSTDTFKTKTGKNRTIPLTDEAFSVLINRWGHQCGELVFHKNGRKHLGNTVAHKFKLGVRAAALSEDLHFHSLRHSCALLLM